MPGKFSMVLTRVGTRTVAVCVEQEIQPQTQLPECGQVGFELLLHFRLAQARIESQRQPATGLVRPGKIELADL